jgi:hypothetical protein
MSKTTCSKISQNLVNTANGCISYTIKVKSLRLIKKTKQEPLDLKPNYLPLKSIMRF